MGEFIEVCRQWERMCHDNIFGKLKTCYGCAMSVANNEKHLLCRDFVQKHPAEAEKTIMDWAEEHPEAVYPTWKEWNDEAFPNTTKYICPQMFIDGLGCALGYCHTCEIREQPIPADIAKKLGIKPKEAER